MPLSHSLDISFVGGMSSSRGSLQASLPTSEPNWTAYVFTV